MDGQEQEKVVTATEQEKVVTATDGYMQCRRPGAIFAASSLMHGSIKPTVTAQQGSSWLLEITVSLPTREVS
jgi:hypothetical protein